MHVTKGSGQCELLTTVYKYYRDNVHFHSITENCYGRTLKK